MIINTKNILYHLTVHLGLVKRDRKVINSLFQTVNISNSLHATDEGEDLKYLSKI